ncbi:formate/nitrite transporter family protein [Lutimaribacter marinistellae]|uniref:Formate/nitrite transporter family protein n=1 Tax=Lutimaribacter marinistellae TaxID=1820329 RepID=A0ABV7TP69_9RHOB
MNEHIRIRRAERLSSKGIYEVIRRDGDEELHRPLKSLVWSGVAAGILIAFSVVGEAVFRVNLPDTPGRYLIENLGYSFGFLLVILGRMQLFTENTITTVLPLVKDRTRTCLIAVLRLWSVVLTANVVGASLAALFIVHGSAFDGAMLEAVNELSTHATGFPAGEGFVRAIPAGVLVASIVWMMPGQNGNEVLMIVLFTWLIAAGDFTHVIAGSVEMWVLVFQDMLQPREAVFSFFLPVLAGNVVGGTAVFAMLAWGQVQAEVEPDPERAQPRSRNPESPEALG